MAIFVSYSEIGAGKTKRSKLFWSTTTGKLHCLSQKGRVVWTTDQWYTSKFSIPPVLEPTACYRSRWDDKMLKLYRFDCMLPSARTIIQRIYVASRQQGLSNCLKATFEEFSLHEQAVLSPDRVQMRFGVP